MEPAQYGFYIIFRYYMCVYIYKGVGSIFFGHSQTALEMHWKCTGNALEMHWNCMGLWRFFADAKHPIIT